jgi:SAM-dependent methyltransferase
MTTTPDSDELTPDAYVEKVSGSVLGAFETLSLYVGDRLGWFSALAHDGAATPTQLAQRTGTAERYCREWLELQACYGNVVVEPAGDQVSRKFRLPEAAAEVLTDQHSLAFLGSIPRMFGAIAAQLPALLAAYRSGGGVSWADFGDDMREAQAAANRPWFESALAPALNGCADVHAVLSRPDARIADVGCGAGWSTVALALAYPQAELVGFDVDQPSIDMARAAATRKGVADRVSFRLAEGESLAEHEQFDAAFAFECLHDMPRPVEVLSAIRASVRPDGLVVVVDEAVADELEAPGDEVDRFMYGCSLFICLPDGLSSTPSAGTGTVFRRSILTDYAIRAGFRDVSDLPIENFGFFRFYRLHG